MVSKRVHAVLLDVARYFEILGVMLPLNGLFQSAYQLCKFLFLLTSEPLTLRTFFLRQLLIVPAISSAFGHGSQLPVKNIECVQ